MAEKKTKLDMYLVIKTALEENEGNPELIGFVDKEIDMIRARAERNKERREKKYQEDPIYEAVLELISDKITPAHEFTDMVNEYLAKKGYAEEATKSKVVARLNRAIDGGLAEKTDIVVDGTKVKGYALLGAVDAIARREAAKKAAAEA